MIYLKFEAPKSNANQIESNRLKDFLLKSTMAVMKRIIPEANPDYEGEIDNVETWLIELDEELKFPNREIGIDVKGNVIMTMPDERNYGYWTDNNLKLDDFKSHFETTELDKEIFDSRWDEFEKTKNY